MTGLTLLIILVTTHVFLLLIAVMVFYSFLLELLHKSGTNKKALLWRSALGFLSILSSWIISTLYLIPYYIGREGFITDPSVNMYIPKLVLIREIIFIPLVILSFLLTLGVWLYGNKVNEYKKHKISLFVLLLATFSTTIVLFLLGIFIP